jgi:hypothetical protein
MSLLPSKGDVLMKLPHQMPSNLGEIILKENKVVNITEKAPHYFAIRTPDKENGPYYLLKVLKSTQEIELVEKFKSLDEWPPEYVKVLMETGDELFSETEQILKSLNAYL